MCINLLLLTMRCEKTASVFRQFDTPALIVTWYFTSKKLDNTLVTQWTPLGIIIMVGNSIHIVYLIASSYT